MPEDYREDSQALYGGHETGVCRVATLADSNHGEKAMNVIYNASLDVSATDEELIDCMRRMKVVRETKTAQHVICSFRGYDNDPREAWAIPEIRALCKRLMLLGFISYLDPSVTLPFKHIADAPDYIKTGFGSLEVWLASENRGGYEVEIPTEELLRFFEETLPKSNAKSDSLVGEFRG